MGEKVVKFYHANAAKEPDNVLEQAIGVYQDVVLIGYNTSGELEVRSSTSWTKEAIAYAVNRFLHKLHNGDYDAD